jgi:hypothetical protein
MFPWVAWIYLAYIILSKYERVFCQVLFSLDGAKNMCSHKTLCYKLVMIIPKVTFINLRDTLRHKLFNHCIKL